MICENNKTVGLCHCIIQKLFKIFIYYRGKCVALDYKLSPIMCLHKEGIAPIKRHSHRFVNIESMAAGKKPNKEVCIPVRSERWFNVMYH